jgi:hypothetical protein
MPSKLNNKPTNFFQRIINTIKSLFGRQRTLFKDANDAFRHILDAEAKADIVDRVEDFEEAQDTKESQEKTEQETNNKDKMLEQIHLINKQFNRILESKTLTSTDLAEVSDVIADLISSKIDELESKRDQVKELLTARNPEDNTDVSKLSRFDLVKAVGIQHFIDLVKQDFVINKRTALPENRAKITEVVKNWDYFINRIKSTLSETEGIHLEVKVTGEKDIAKDDVLVDQYEEDGTNIQDQVEDGQLSWQVENNTIDPVTSMTQLVRLQLRGLYELRDNGRRDDNDNILYDHVRTKWGTDAKVGHTRAAKCLLKWLNEVPSVDGMVEVLESKAKKRPWVTQLIPKLSDKSGTYTTEQSQFFSTFYKPFMKFTNVGKKGDVLTSRQLNEHPFLTLTIKTIEASYKLGQHPLVANGLESGVKELISHYDSLKEAISKNDKGAIEDMLRIITKDLGFEINVAECQLEDDEIQSIFHELGIITTMVGRNATNPEYDPFAYNKDGIRSNLMRFFEKLTDQFEDEAITSFYEGGKMRQSYLLPSYLTMFSSKFHLEDKAFNRFLLSEFNSEFFRTSLFKEGIDDDSLAREVKKGWTNVWLSQMMSDPRKRRNFRCKTSLTFNNGKNQKVYMRGMTAEEYALAAITEFFGEQSNDTEATFLANFRVPIESNKPSAEYITFYARGGSFYKDDLVNDFLSVFNQELSRIKTVKLRKKLRDSKIAELQKRLDAEEITKQQFEAIKYNILEEAITNFDTRGEQFVFLDFLNSELPKEGFAGTELGKLIDKSSRGEKIDKNKLAGLAAEAIRTSIQARVDSMIDKFKANGVFEQCKTINKVEGTDKVVQNKLELFLWNDAFASTQIMQLLISDPALLKSTDDVQKRFAQVHASGNRANLAATTFKEDGGIPVTDGVHRSITLRDIEKFNANVIDNLTAALDQRIAKAENDAERISWEAFKERLVGEEGLYRKKTNLADAQAYSCPTSYRKKALMFGLWSKEAEEAYKRIKSGNYTFSDVSIAFQPFKPFLFGNSIEDTGVDAEGTISKMRVSVQNKNAECLLVMADAIIGDSDTGKPNLLRALFNVMEDSHKEKDENGNPIEGTYRQDGIDTVNFESAVKSGGQGRIDTQAYAGGKQLLDGTMLGHEKAFEDQLRSIIYTTKTINVKNAEGQSEEKTVTVYNKTSVKHIGFENYCMQQAVPEHFLDHSQLEGSQQRALIPSDLATVDAAGKEVLYKINETTSMTADELRARYDQLHADNIQKGIDEINTLFNLNNSTAQQRKEALSKLLVDQFLADGRYSGDMLYMVTLNEETGDFPVSLEDPMIRNQVEQAINSIIKSRVNKLKMKGGPLVQMSNFGMSKELKIKFKSKDGQPLKERAEFNSDEEYKSYLEENQAGIDHYEVIAPAYTEGIFQQFADNNGNISVEALELLEPDLLKMIGYRIPTEAKYSIAPLKIVGFAPKEMGDVIILPAEITLITGSDFDVDKEYCMRKTLDIVPKIFLSKENQKLSPEEQANIRSSIAARKLAKEPSVKELSKDMIALADRFVNDPYNKKLWLSEGLTEEQYKDILKSYVNIMFEVKPAKGVDANNNEIFDMSYSVLTNETNVAKLLKPGGFEEHKHIAYAVSAYRLPEIREKGISFDTLLKMDTGKLGKLIEKSDKNLMYFDTQLEYYGNNNSASSLLGISAVNSVAHAILVSDNIGLDLTGTFIPTIAGNAFSSKMQLDKSLANDNASIAETLGSCVAASADAAKDPVLNFMNLNPQTFNVYTTLIRLGIPNSVATLLMSSKVLGDAVVEANARTLKGEWSTPESILREKMSDDELKDLGYDIQSPIFTEPITRDELIKGLVDDDLNVSLKISKALIALFDVSRKVRLADQVTRYNSISSAVGPSTLDNYIFQEKLKELDNSSSLVDMNNPEGDHLRTKQLLERHKMLSKFSEAYKLADSVLVDDMPLTSAFLDSIKTIYATPFVAGLELKFGLPDVVKGDRAVMGKLRDFFTAWTAVKNGLVNYDELGYLSKQFPRTLTAKKKEHSDNYLAQNLYLNIDNRSGFPIVAMNISMIEKESRDKLAASWADLYTKDEKFAMDLFKYSFFRGGLGFSPKTFMSVLPIQMKVKMKGYLDLFKKVETLSETEVNLMYKQFISNNYMDNKVAPVMSGISPDKNGRITISKDNKKANSFKGVTFFKTITKPNTEFGEPVIRLYQCVGGYEEGPVYRMYEEIPKLGAEGNFLELSTEEIEQSEFDVRFD